MTNKPSLKNFIDTTVMILAAGEGRRMQPLTLTTPKPLLPIGELSLLEHHLSRLSSLGFKNIVINIAHLGAMIKKEISNLTRYDLNIEFSDESGSGALETAGGIINALPLINSDPFLVINADIYTDFSFSKLLRPLQENELGRLVLVKNPSHNQSGDFCHDSKEGLRPKSRIDLKSYTFSGIALYRKSAFAGLTPGKRALAPILHSLIEQQKLDGMVYEGSWTDVGTPQRLDELNSKFN
ncbi:MAG: nucleotidyltransferase family protein [Acidiferrobacterales bacterium]|nr:nucleotidyltransferase family protein [Acidiferrobacterales bacterium]